LVYKPQLQLLNLARDVAVGLFKSTKKKRDDENGRTLF